MRCGKRKGEGRTSSGVDLVTPEGSAYIAPFSLSLEMASRSLEASTCLGSSLQAVGDGHLTLSARPAQLGTTLFS